MKHIADQLRDFIEHDPRTLYGIAKQAGMTLSHLLRFMNGDASISLDKMDGLCGVLGLRLTDRPLRTRKGT